MIFGARRGKDEAEVERSPLGWSSNKVGNYTVSSLASAYVDRNADLTSQTANGQRFPQTSQATRSLLSCLFVRLEPIELFVWLLGKANKANKWTLLALTTCEVACLWEPLLTAWR
jgi:hypothetical protein